MAVHHRDMALDAPACLAESGRAPRRASLNLARQVHSGTSCSTAWPDNCSVTMPLCSLEMVDLVHTGTRAVTVPQARTAAVR